MIEPTERLAAALSDRYRIHREIGKGGMATVYLAEDLRHGRKVAVKVLIPELAAVLGAERFLSEIHVTAALQHPNILPLFDSGQADGQLFYVMPFVEGESLRARVDRERQLPVDDALRIAHEVGSALGYAHRQGVIHRDIKPENILLHDGHALVADFGIALAVTTAGGGRLTQTGLSLGTPQYMSPEQATGEREIDARSDLYSLAAVTYEMLGGEPPHTGATMQAVIARMLTERPRNIRSHRPSVPEHVATALDVALERIPADRWHSVDEFLRAVDGTLTRTGRPSSSARTTLRSTAAAAAAKRFRDPVFLGMTVIAVAALAFAGISMMRKSNVTDFPTSRFVLTLPEGVQFSPTIQNSFALSPDGRWIAFTGRDSTPSVRVFLRAIGDTRVTPIPGTDGAFGVWFSPDGRWIGVAGSNGIQKVSVETREVLGIGSIRGIYGGSTWTPRGEIVMSSSNVRLYAMSVNGGPERKVCGKSGDRIIAQIQPLTFGDGDHVLFSGGLTSQLSSARLGVASLRTGECKLFDVPAIQPLGVIDGVVTFATASGVIMAARFNERSRELEGDAVPLMSDVDFNQTTGAAQATLARNGTLLYLTASSTSQLVKVNSQGVAEPLVSELREYAYPRYSPDAKKIAIAVATTSERDIWVIDLAGGTMTRLTSGGFISDRPEWSPDGKRILYRSSRGVRSSIWWRSADMSDQESPLLEGPDDDYYEGVITPDGSSLVFQADTANANIFVQVLSGDRKRTALAATEFVEDMARLSPDGKWLAYTSNTSGLQEVYVQPFPGPGARVQVSARGGSEPVWSRDGSRLYYRDVESVMAASVRTQPGFEVTGREKLFPDVFIKASLPHAGYDVAPDGSFLFLRGAANKKVVIVGNWMAEVRARLQEGARK